MKTIISERYVISPVNLVGVVNRKDIPLLTKWLTPGDTIKRQVLYIDEDGYHRAEYHDLEPE